MMTPPPTPSKPLTEKELEEMEKLLEKATQGELQEIRAECSLIEKDEFGAEILDDGDEIGNNLIIKNSEGKYETVDMTDDDAKLYIALRNNAESMIAELKRLRAGPTQAREKILRGNPLIPRRGE